MYNETWLKQWSVWVTPEGSTLQLIGVTVGSKYAVMLGPDGLHVLTVEVLLGGKYTPRP